jgi:hypothetical protein
VRSMKRLQRSKLLRTARLPLLVLAVGTQSAAGQVVRGNLVDAVSGRPVPAGIVVLVDTSGVEQIRTLTDATGSFVARAHAPGVFRLRTLIVGFEGWESEPFSLARGQSVERQIALTFYRVELPELTVEAERTCVVRPEEGLAASALWNEVKKALAATRLSMERRKYRFRTRTSERQLDPYGVVRGDTMYISPGYSSWPFASLPADRLSQLGFVQNAPDGPVFYGPDAEVLVSDVFLDDHCFRVRLDDDRRGYVGLAFEPVSGREVPEVEGVLWLDSVSVVLRRLEWSYLNVSRWARAGDPRGFVEFAALPDGAWFIRRWMLRAPVAHVFVGRPDTLLYGVKVRESEVLDVLDRRGEPILRYSPPDSVRQGSKAGY